MNGWNAAHEREDDALPPPSPEQWEKDQERILANPKLTGVHVT